MAHNWVNMGEILNFQFPFTVNLNFSKYQLSCVWWCVANSIWAQCVSSFVSATYCPPSIYLPLLLSLSSSFLFITNIAKWYWWWWWVLLARYKEILTHNKFWKYFQSLKNFKTKFLFSDMNSVLYFKGNWENKNKKTSSSVFLIFLELQTRAFLANRISKILITKHFISARQYIDPLLALLLSSILALIFFVNQFRFLIGYWTGSLGVCVSVCV